MPLNFMAEFLVKKSKLPNRPGLVGPVFHGTSQNFSDFKLPEEAWDDKWGLGIHFGTPEQAGEFAWAEGSSVHPVYLRIHRPLRLPDMNEWNPEDVGMQLFDRRVINRQQYEELRRLYLEPEGLDYTACNVLLRKFIEERGYDSVVYQNSYEENKGDSYIVWHPDQIKSAFAASREKP